MFTPNPVHPEKYARLEEERRFLLKTAPPDLDLAHGYLRIIDHYLVGTRLRLRRMETPQGEPVAYKFGQKYRTPDQQPHQARMTNLYLNQAEYDTLLALGGAPLTKRRYGYLQAGMRYSLDIFEGPLAGLILAEIEAHAAGEITRLPVPVFAVREVTADPAFSGGALAQLSPQAFARWQAEW